MDKLDFRDGIFFWTIIGYDSCDKSLEIQSARRRWALGKETPDGTEVTELARIMAKLLS